MGMHDRQPLRQDAVQAGWKIATPLPVLQTRNPQHTRRHIVTLDELRQFGILAKEADFQTPHV
jgi:hypothetical protein